MLSGPGDENGACFAAPSGVADLILYLRLKGPCGHDLVGLFSELRTDDGSTA
jgi:hypothetical protein